jgi:hypothetical protein
MIYDSLRAQNTLYGQKWHYGAKMTRWEARHWQKSGRSISTLLAKIDIVSLRVWDGKNGF